MAGNENSGGFRPTAPQNNPANVSATGGAGQSGTQPARYMSGLAYGQGQAQMEQQTAAPMAGNPTANVATQTTPQLPQITSIDAPTQRPDVPITNGIDIGPGAGSEALVLPTVVPGANLDTSAQLVQALYMQDPNNADVRRMMEVIDAERSV